MNSKKRNYLSAILIICLFIIVGIIGFCIWRLNRKSSISEVESTTTEVVISQEESIPEAMTESVAEVPVAVESIVESVSSEPEPIQNLEPLTIEWNPEWEYADYSQIHESSAVLYYANGDNRKNYVVSVNAGHGTPGGEAVKTLCHPDGSPKVTGGTTSAGATHAIAVSSGMTFLDGTPEAEANLSLAEILKEKLLENGYDVLMIRSDADCRLDNVARTVMSNENAQCHIAIHYDSSESDKGAYYCAVPNNASYRAMEPVASTWQEHIRFGEALVSGLRMNNISIYGSGALEMDLTQTSYSKIPSIDIEVGDKASDHSYETQSQIADGLVDGVDIFFEAA